MEGTSSVENLEVKTPLMTPQRNGVKSDEIPLESIAPLDNIKPTEPVKPTNHNNPAKKPKPVKKSKCCAKVWSFILGTFQMLLIIGLIFVLFFYGDLTKNILSTVAIIGILLFAGFVCIKRGKSDDAQYFHLQAKIKKEQQQWIWVNYNEATEFISKKLPNVFKDNDSDIEDDDDKDDDEDEEEKEKDEKDEKDENVDLEKNIGKTVIVQINNSMIENNDTQIIADILLRSLDPKNDTIILNIESAGGAIHSYGLAYAELARLKKAGFEVITCIDKVAASGGYLLALAGTKILAAPFAIVGSVGVVAEVVNVNDALTKLGVNVVQLTSGEFKRPLSNLGPIDKNGVEHEKEKMKDMHEIFIKAVQGERKNIDIEKIKTADVWLGAECINLGLVDEVKTMSEFLYTRENCVELMYVEDEKLNAKMLMDLVGVHAKKFFYKFINL